MEAMCFQSFWKSSVVWKREKLFQLIFLTKENKRICQLDGFQQCSIEYNICVFECIWCGLYFQGPSEDEAVSATAAGVGGEAAQYGTGTSTSQLQPVQLQQQQAAKHSAPHSVTNTGGHFQKFPTRG